MTLLLTALHIIACFALILIVLLQTGKGAEMGAAFGSGSSQTVFGSEGMGGFMTKLTAAAAIIFMITSFTLASISREKTTLMDKVSETTEQSTSARTAEEQKAAEPIAESQGEGQAEESPTSAE